MKGATTSADWLVANRDVRGGNTGKVQKPLLVSQRRLGGRSGTSSCPVRACGIETLFSSAREFTFGSSWVIARTLERGGLLAAFAKAAGRGATIDVFVDPLLNQTAGSTGATQLETAGLRSQTQGSTPERHLSFIRKSLVSVQISCASAHTIG